MNCSRFETLLTSYLDQTLDEHVQGVMSEHATTCPHCSVLLSRVQSLQEDLAHFPEADPPQDLADRILELTSGKPRRHSLWQDLIVPTISPFLTQRYAFATVIMFVFLSLMVNTWGPGFTGLSASDLNPSTLLEESYRLSNQAYKKWVEFREFRSRAWEELKLWKEDLSGRLDYHLINMLFQSYSESLPEEQQQNDQPDSQPETQEGSDES